MNFQLFDDFFLLLTYADHLPRRQSRVIVETNLSKTQIKQERLMSLNLQLAAAQESLQKLQIQGEICLLQKDYLGARNFLTNYLKEHPNCEKALQRRAKANRRLGQYKDVKQDAEAILKLNQSSAKGLLLLGISVAVIGKSMEFELALQQIDHAITTIQKGYNAISEQRDGYRKIKFQKHLLRVKKLKWYLRKGQIEEKNKEINREIQKQSLNPILQQELQDKLEIQYKTTEIPNYYICSITQEIILNPAVTEAGIVYERSAIEKHIELCGPRDPLTRSEISTNLYECNNLKQGIMEYLDKNPWAFEHSQADDYTTLKI